MLTRAARTFGVAQMIPTLASCGFDEIVDAAGDVVDDGHDSGKAERQVQWLQLYVSKLFSFSSYPACWTATDNVLTAD